MEHPSATPAGRYLEQLSATDLALLCSVADYHTGSDDAATYLRSRPQLIEPALATEAAHDRLLVHPGGEHADEWPSPFLLFALAVHRGVADLATTSFVAEPLAGHRRIPVFDTASLRDHFDDPYRRLYAVEHLASYTRVASGPIWVRGPHGRGWRRHRYSELDPTRLAAALDLVPEEDKPGIYRRLGDLALFLTGVFPDHTAKQAAHPITLERLLRSARAAGGEPFRLDEVSDLAGGAGLDGVLRRLGPRWYDLAAQRAPLPGVRRLLADAAKGFDKTRRFLMLLTDRYLFPTRDQWFGRPATG